MRKVRFHTLLVNFSLWSYQTEKSDFICFFVRINSFPKIFTAVSHFKTRTKKLYVLQGRLDTWIHSHKQWNKLTPVDIGCHKPKEFKPVYINKFSYLLLSLSIIKVLILHAGTQLITKQTVWNCPNLHTVWCKICTQQMRFFKGVLVLIELSNNKPSHIRGRPSTKSLVSLRWKGKLCPHQREIRWSISYSRPPELYDKTEGFKEIVL